MSVVGLPFTLVALAGWIALLVSPSAIPGGRRAAPRGTAPARRPRRRPVLRDLVPHADGDTVKGSFMLTAVPAWAARFGFAFDGLRSRYQRFSIGFLVVLAVLALVATPFLLAVPEL